ncbi:C2H2 finger domain-containing protein [Histoplasma capsulatum H143]|uniref:C2H2 finger domain-containing protein n=1 Tax=Ajellomyces capsulatus (strain H143) TaxID=544712 RepID=C6HRV1_AJECH|nr:C2H2 finger domain-containing protein [Histoplasma capsulatum H143]
MFKNSSLQLMKNIQKLILTDDCQKLLLSLKQKMNNWYIFCKIDIQNEQVHILYNTSISMSTLDSQLKSISKIHEFHNTFFFHQLCYNKSKLLDESEFVSDLKKNVIMNHTINYIFIIYYYIQHHISLQEIIYDLELNEVFSQVHQPHYLTDVKRVFMEKDLKLQTIICIQKDLIDLYTYTQNTALMLLLQEQQQKFSQKQTVIDIEHQLSEFKSALDNKSAQKML